MCVCVFLPLQSTDTLCPEQDISSKDRGGSLGSRPNANSDAAATSAVLNRPGITHQGKHCVCVCVCLLVLRINIFCILKLQELIMSAEERV